MAALPLPDLVDDRRSNTISSASAGEEEEEMINIYLNITKTVALSVKKTEMIENLKALMHEKEGVSQYLQELFFAGIQLENGKSLVDYGVQKDTTLHLVEQTLVRQKIFIKTPSNQKTIEVEARTYDTIQNIKSMIQLKEGIRSDQYTLVCNGVVLDDDRTVASASTESHSTFHMVFNSKDVLSVFVKAPSGETVKLKVKASFTVGDVKEIFSSMTCLPVTGRSLTYSGVQLEDYKILACYDIKEESILEMVPSWIQIFVKFWSGETITLDVQLCDTIENVKGKILNKLKPNQNQLNVPKYASLVYAGKRLEDDRELANYNIQKHATLLMVFSPSSTMIKKRVTRAAGPPLPDSTKIWSLKAMIREEMRSPVKEILFRGMPMSDHLSMADYGMNNDSEVVIVL